MPSEEIQRKLGALQTLQTILLCSVIFALCVMIGLAGYAAIRTERNTAKLEQVAKETRRVVCGLRAENLRRQKRTQTFIDSGRVIEGITPDEIEQQLRDLQTTYTNAYSQLTDCGGVK